MMLSPLGHDAREGRGLLESPVLRPLPCSAGKPLYHAAYARCIVPKCMFIKPSQLRATPVTVASVANYFRLRSEVKSQQTLPTHLRF